MTDAPGEGVPEQQTPRPWSSAKGVLFRFGLVYFLLYAHPFPLYLVPTPAEVAAIFDYKASWIESTQVVDTALSDYSTWWTRQERWAVDAVAEHVFGFDHVLDRPYGSGDPMFSYILVLLQALLAALLTTLWCCRSGPRRDHPRLAAWTQIGLRFYLAIAMLSYGLSKVLPTQFPPWLRLDRLLAPWGDSSPMSVLWSAMSSSEMYTIFGGAGEVLAGVLLVFRRTATLGALVATGVMVNVVAMNICYDIPVKLYSSHLVLAAIAIAWPDVRRLLAVLIRNRATAPRDLRYPHLPIAGAILKTLIIAAFVVPGIRSRLQRMDAYDDLPQHFGIWDVRRFDVDGQTVPPLATDIGAWKHLVIDRGDRCSIHRHDGTRMQQTLTREDDGSLTLKTSSDWEPEVEGDRLELTGQFAWRFLADLGDDSSTLAQENREPRLRWTLARVQKKAEEPAASDAATATDEGAPAWLGTWQVERREVLSDRYTPRRQPAPSSFTTLAFAADGALVVTLPGGRQDTFGWEVTEDARTTLRLTAEGSFAVERDGDTMKLAGTFRGHEVQAQLQQRDLDEFQLLRRGFHWVNPIPWNRY